MAFACQILFIPGTRYVITRFFFFSEWHFVSCVCVFFFFFSCDFGDFCDIWWYLVIFGDVW